MIRYKWLLPPTSSENQETAAYALWMNLDLGDQKEHTLCVHDGQ